MIKISDSIMLAATKLKSRRVRLIITIVVAGLLFVGLTFASLIFNGTMNSIEKFSEEGFGKRYITKLESLGYNGSVELFSDPDLATQARQADKDLIAAKTAEAKRLGIEYDPKLEMLSYDESNRGPNGEVWLVETPQAAPLFRQKRIDVSKAYFESVAKAQNEYDVKARYNMVTVATGMMIGIPGSAESSSLTVLKDGKEKAPSSEFGPEIRGLDSLVMGLSAADKELLSTFTLPEQTLDVGADGSIPLIAPFGAAEEALGLARLPENAPAQARLERTKEVRQKAAGLKFQVCLRNQASLSRQDEAEQLNSTIARGKGQKDFVMPELVYAKSDKPCEDVVVTRDVRTSEAKALSQKQAQFDAKFGRAEAAQRIVDFRIVGVVPNPPGFGGFSVRTLVASLLNSNLGSGWFMPMESATTIPEFRPAIEDTGLINDFNSYVLFEFASADDVKKFSDEQSCSIETFTNSNPYEACDEKGTPFFLSGFGSNSVAIESAKKGFVSSFQKVGLVISAISIIIMMGTIGKVIADSRRETAVFRAIGAKRADIAQIYLSYSLMLGFILVVTAIGVAWLLVKLVEARYSVDITVDALTLFNATDLSRRFSLVGVDFRQLLTIVVFIIGGCLLSAVGPLLSNLKRNPIRDMRDER